MREFGGQGLNCGHAELFTVNGPSPTQTESPGAGHESPATPARLSDIELSRSRLALRVSSPAKISIVITALSARGRGRSGSTHRGVSGRVIKLTLTAHTAGKVIHRFRRRLSTGSYWLELSLITSGKATSKSLSRIVPVR
jgi:hypothetical protein